MSNQSTVDLQLVLLLWELVKGNQKLELPCQSIICRPSRERLPLQVYGALATVLLQQEEEGFSPQLHQPNQWKAIIPQILGLLQWTFSL